MRICEIHAENVPPIKQFDVMDLADVVVLAGPNGVGKTSLVVEMLQTLRDLTRNHNVHLVIEATCQEERDSWGKNSLETRNLADVAKLTKTLQTARRRTSWTSCVIQFESDRSIQQIAAYDFTWDVPDPWDEPVGWQVPFSPLHDRFKDTQHAIFRKVQSLKNDIANRAIELKSQGHRNLSLDFADPLLPFKQAFSQLLAPKELLEPDPKRQQLRYSIDGKVLPISSLSSGEREVVNIVFDFILRNPTHSIIIFDEPELHLHPELSYKLLQTLRGIGESNQFIFCTHSPDIITASLENSVIFLAPPKEPVTNQAIVVREEDTTYQALKLLGQSIGVIALGKKLVLIEGADSSLDKQTYGAILKNRFPNLVLVPSGGKELIRSFSSVITTVLERTIWGVEFFMLCDKDALPTATVIDKLEEETAGRLKVLGRYHLENYFLDENVLAAIFATMEPEDSWLRDPAQINATLKDLARSKLSYAAALNVSAQFRLTVGNLSSMPSGCHNKSVEELVQLMCARMDAELSRIATAIDPSLVEAAVRETFTLLEKSLEDSANAWKYVIPGKQLFHEFASRTSLGASRLKTLYIREAENHIPYPFADIVAIFEQFSSM